MSAVDQSRIAKNTILLYVRMGIIMLISLYTSRVVLSELGEVDFGLYGAVGGIVVAFSFLNGVMSTACNRYFAIEIGKEDWQALKKVFCLNVTIFALIAAIILLLSESVGLWFLNAKMVFPAQRASAVQWVYQFSIISFVLNMVSTPFRAIIIAREKMKVFAYSSLVEAFLKLGIVFLLASAAVDKLVLYALLMLCVTAGVSLFYIAYCTRFYDECKYRFFWDKALFREIVGYTGWNVFGSLAGIGRSQGINLLLNMFFGPAVNAARGIAYQVYVNVNQLVSNFMMAANPQIMKSYAAGEKKEMFKLVFQSTKFSYFLLLVFVLPICLETPFILDIWLKDVPAHTVAFTRLILLMTLIDATSNPVYTSLQATGRIKWSQILVGSSWLMILPVSYVALKFFGAPSEAVFVIAIVFTFIGQIIRLVFMRLQLGMDIKAYLKEVVWAILLVSALSAGISAGISALACGLTPWVKALTVILGSMIITGACAFLLGMTEGEREFMLRPFKKLFARR